MRPEVSIVIPVYQNAGSIEQLCSDISSVFEHRLRDTSYEVVFVDDGSTDGSWTILKRLYAERPGTIGVIRLTRNFGQMSALLAGYREARGKCVISMSADGQDPPEAIERFVDAWRDGHKLVVANRVARNDGAITNFISNASWRLLRSYALPEIPEGGFDYFLMDQEIREFFVKDPESHIFMQGRLLFYGIAPYVVPYERKKRLHGKSQTTLQKRLSYLADGFAGYSYLPLRLVSILGVAVFVAALVAALFVVWSVVMHGSKAPGWASLMVVILFLNGLQLLAFGIFGEYLWLNVEETRRRPHYLIAEKAENLSAEKEVEPTGAAR